MQVKKNQSDDHWRLKPFQKYVAFLKVTWRLRSSQSREITMYRLLGTRTTKRGGTGMWAWHTTRL